MKKGDTDPSDDLRPEYKRSDFGEMMRGKYSAALDSESNVVVLDPEVSKAFPNDKAVNAALRGLLQVVKAAHLTNTPGERKTG